MSATKAKRTKRSQGDGNQAPERIGDDPAATSTAPETINPESRINDDMNMMSNIAAHTLWNPPAIGAKLPLFPAGLSADLLTLIEKWKTCLDEVNATSCDEDTADAVDVLSEVQDEIQEYPARSIGDVAAKLAISAFAMNGAATAISSGIDTDNFLLIREKPAISHAEPIFWAAAADAARLAKEACGTTSSGWSKLLEAYQKAKATEDNYSRVHIDPYYPEDLTPEQRRNAGNEISRDVWDEIKRLADIRSDAEEPLMAHPSPDATAFARKFLIAYGDERDANHWNDMLVEEASWFVGQPVTVTDDSRWAAAEAAVSAACHALESHDGSDEEACRLNNVFAEAQRRLCALEPVNAAQAIRQIEVALKDGELAGVDSQAIIDRARRVAGNSLLLHAPSIPQPMNGDFFEALTAYKTIRLLSSKDGLPDEELDRLADLETKAAHDVLAAPATNLESIAAKLRTILTSYETPHDDLFEGVLTDIEGFGAGSRPSGSNPSLDCEPFAQAWLDRWKSHGGSVTRDHTSPDKLWFGHLEFFLSPDGKAFDERTAQMVRPETMSEASWNDMRDRDRTYCDGAFRGTMRELLDLLDSVPGGKEAVKAIVRRDPSAGLPVTAASIKETMTALRDFLAAGFRVFITPQGEIDESGSMPKEWFDGERPRQIEIERASRAFTALRRRPRADEYIARAIRMLGDRREASGFVVLSRRGEAACTALSL